MNWKVFSTFCLMAEKGDIESVGQKFLEHLKEKPISKKDKALLRKLLTAATWEEHIVKDWERKGHAIKFTLSPNDFIWLAPSNFPSLIPQAPRVSMLGLRNVAIGLRKALASK